jgi:hypothetical protein
MTIGQPCGGSLIIGYHPVPFFGINFLLGHYVGPVEGNHPAHHIVTVYNLGGYFR